MTELDMCVFFLVGHTHRAEPAYAHWLEVRECRRGTEHNAEQASWDVQCTEHGDDRGTGYP